MDKKICWVFAGQGSQYLGMGQHLYSQHSVFKTVMDQGSQYLASITGQDLVAILYSKDNQKTHFDDLSFTHPAIVLLQVALAKTLLSEGVIFDFLWGNSIGELAVAVLAEVLSLKDALSVCLTQAECVKAFAPRGGMVAVMSDPEHYRSIPQLAPCEWAGQSFGGHFTLSGLKHHLSDVVESLRSERIFHQKIAVEYPFHSYYIDPVQSPFLEAIQGVGFNQPQTPCYSSAVVGQVLNFNAEHTWNAVRQPIQFQKTFERMLSKANIFVDLSPSATISTLIKYNKTEHTIQSFSTLKGFQKNISWLSKLKDDLGVE